MAATSAAEAAPVPIEADVCEREPEAPPLLREILTQYSGVPKDDTIQHIVTSTQGCNCSNCCLEEYPRFRRYISLTFSMTNHRLYHAHILPTLKRKAHLASNDPTSSHSLARPIYLELGAGYAHEIRGLIYHGVPVERLYGADSDAGRLRRSYRLFQDEDTLPESHLISEVDLLDEASFKDEGTLGKFRGQIDILCLVCVFHLWDWDTQVKFAKHLLPLMRRGGVIVGCQYGSEVAERRPTTEGGDVLRHDRRSWEDMWTEHVTDGGEITDPEASAQGAKLGLYTEVVKANDTQMPRGLNIYQLKEELGSQNWYWDSDFRWMRFEIWIGKRPPPIRQARFGAMKQNDKNTRVGRPSVKYL